MLEKQVTFFVIIRKRNASVEKNFSTVYRKKLALSRKSKKELAQVVKV